MKKELSSTQKALDIWAVILIIWSIYRYKFSFPSWFDEFFTKPALFILPIYFYITRIEKKDFLKSIWIDKKNILKDVPLGIIIGLTFFASAAISGFIRYNNFSKIFPENHSSILLSFFLALATGISEEILSRGFLLKTLYQDSKNILSASITGSVLFFILHIPILFTMKSIKGELLLLFMITSFLLSLSNSFLFLTRKSLVLPILVNAFYSFAILLYI